MSVKRNLSFLLALILGSSPLSAFAQGNESDGQSMSEIKSLQQLDELELDGASLKKGEDYSVDIQYSNDYSKAFVNFSFTSQDLSPQIVSHNIGDIEGFEDIDPNYYARESINYAADLGWVSGKADGGFHPTEELKRGELVTILYRMAGSPVEEVHETLADLDPANPVYFTQAALWAVKHGIIKGYTDNDGSVRFKGDQAITREELAVMLHRYQGEEGASADLSSFADGSQVGSPYLLAMQWCVEHGIITGSPLNGAQYINPQSSATRAATATMLERFNKTRGDLLQASLQSSEEEQEDSDIDMDTLSPACGWNEAGDTFISFETGQPVKGVLDLNGVLYYFNTEGKLVKNQIVTIHSKNYSIDQNGAIKHGFELQDNKPYYYSLLDGHQQSGKKHYDGKDYRLNVPQDEQGMLENINGTFYCKFSDGSLAKDEELSLNGNNYYFDGTGAMVHDSYANGSYFDSEGKKVISRAVTIEDKNYYFGPDGKIVKAQAVTLPDGTSIYCDYRDGHLIDAREFKVEGEALAVINEVGSDLHDLFMWSAQTNFTNETPWTLTLPEYGELAFETRTGNCYVFAASFYYFAYLLGYDVIYIRGQVMTNAETDQYGPHTWVGIYDETGKLYFYDPGCQYDFQGRVEAYRVDPLHDPLNLKYDPSILFK